MLRLRLPRLTTLSTPTNTIVWLKVAGVWKQCTIWIKISGTWKQATTYLKVSGTWK